MSIFKFMEGKTTEEEGVTLSQGKKWFMEPKFWVIVGIVVVVIIVLLFILGSRNLLPFQIPFVSGGVDPKTYQAVFLANNQVYFGKLHLGRDWVRLNDIYYLRVSRQLQPPTENGEQQVQQSLQMIKLGGELHQPEDEMFIDPDKILFWENLRRDSQVVQFIESFKAKQ